MPCVTKGVLGFLTLRSQFKCKHTRITAIFTQGRGSNLGQACMDSYPFMGAVHSG